MTAKKFLQMCFAAFVLAFLTKAEGQNAESLRSVRSIFVGSLGTRPGAQELRLGLVKALRHSHQFRVVDSEAQADVLMEGIGERWIRSYHSLNPRARTSLSYAEPVYTGYLSVEVKGKRGEALWSYFATPKPVMFGDLKHELASQIVDQLGDAVHESSDSNTQVAGTPTGAVTLRGAGATFPLPLYQQWFASFQAGNPQVQFTYQPIGSRTGMEQLLSSQLDFAGSDLPVSEFKTAAASSRLLEFPSVVGAVVMIYNLPRFDGELRLDPGALTGILNGKIQKWNDPALLTLNHKSSLPNESIRVVHRSDGSGTTFALTEYLSKVSDSWRNDVGAGPLVKWPVGSGAEGNEGVAKLVEETPYSVGYVEFIYAFRHHLNFASLRNAAGNFVVADLSTITAAASQSSPSLHASLSDASGRNTYPIATYTWLVIPAETADSAKRATLRQFLQWMLSSGQKQCMSLGYAPLPSPVVQQARDLLQHLN